MGVSEARAAPLFVLVAGERSGDALGAGLIAALRAHYPNAAFAGVTGPAMRAAGCRSWGDIESLSLFGVGEVIMHIPRLWRFRRRLWRRVRVSRPAAFVGIDAPAFNTGLERRVKKLGVPTIHYVCPTAWAWRAGRTRAIRRAVHRLLAIFPFEPAFFEARGIPTTFVGHPLAEQPLPAVDRSGARAALGLVPGGPLVGVLPGSRASEIQRIGPAFLTTARWLAARIPGVRFIVPVATPALRGAIEAQLAALAPALEFTLIDGRARTVMQAADALLVASGTATLEAALANTPMVVAYRLSAFNYALARVFKLIKVEHVSMPNLLAGRALVPEFLQNEAVPARMGEAALELLRSPAARAAQVEAFAAIRERLAQGADRRAAAAVAALVSPR